MKELLPVRVIIVVFLKLSGLLLITTFINLYIILAWLYRE